MTTVYVARDLGVDTGVMTPGAIVGTIVGGDTALDSRDDDGSYVVVAQNGSIFGPPNVREQVPFRWERISGSAPGGSVTVTIEAEYRKDDTATQATSAASLQPFVVGPPGPWFTSTTDYTFSTEAATSNAVAAMEAGTPWLIFPFDAGVTTRLAFRLTYLVATIEAAPYLRQRLRDRTRVRDLASRQRSTRVRGYL